MQPRGRKRPFSGVAEDAMDSTEAPAPHKEMEWRGDSFPPPQPCSSFDLLASLRLRAYKMQGEDNWGGSSGDHSSSGVCVPVCGLVFPDKEELASRVVTRACQKKIKKDKPQWVLREGTYSIAIRVQACKGTPNAVKAPESFGGKARALHSNDAQDKRKKGELESLAIECEKIDEVAEQALKWQKLSQEAGCARCIRKEAVLEICGGKKGPPILPLPAFDPSLGKNAGVGRLNRPGANVRHLGKAGTHQALPWAVLKMGRFVVRRSLIAEYGVYSTESIPPGELLMEYVGEVIRKEVAELREEYLYSEQGTYLFSLGPDWVIDATKTGNMARYINHSCDPNCVAELVRPCTRDSRGAAHQRRVFIYSKKDISPGEELSYDYKLSLPDVTFPEGEGDDADQSQGQPNASDAKLKCGCGAASCRGFL